MDDCHFTVGSKVFKNKFEALHESSTTTNTVNFHLFENAFDQADWSQDPSLSWDQLLDIRAQQIAAKNKKIILGFSGGTDSITVYDVFIRNNIIPDYVHIRTKPKDLEQNLFYKDPLTFIEEERKKHGFRVIITEESFESLEEWYDTPEWILRPTARIEFTNGLAESQTIEYNTAYQHNIDQNYCYVVGLEKPYCIFYQGSFFSHQYDQDWMHSSDPRVEPFFVSPDLPDLHIKQSYMLANYIVSLAIKEGNPLEYYHTLKDPDKNNYSEIATIGCGRFRDLANSTLQKKLNKNSRLSFVNDNLKKINYLGRSLTSLREGIKTNERFALNYLDGIRLLTSDSALKKYFNNSNNLFKLPTFLSKGYKLNINLYDHKQ